MLTNAFIICRRPNRTESRTFRVMNFTFVKDAYTPYTHVNATFIIEDDMYTPFDVPSEYSEAHFFINNRVVHVGLVDLLQIRYEGGVKKGVLSSRGFTSLLLDNQMKPGLYPDISINMLMDNYYSFHMVTHESSTETNYIYVKSGSSMWDALVSLSYKVHGKYPHIRGTNQVVMTVGNPESRIVLDSDIVFSHGTEVNTKKMASDFHMADVTDEYGNFDYINYEARGKNVVRNRYFELDRRFLYEPQTALAFRNALAAMRFKRKFVVYDGYQNEDLYDVFSFGDIREERIKSIKITGDRMGIRTELSAYDDYFT